MAEVSAIGEKIKKEVPEGSNKGKDIQRGINDIDR
jgi:hypothetical protein